MKRLVLCFLIALAAAALVPGSSPAGALSTSDIGISHTAPSVVLPGLQINLTAVLTNATAASVSWNNGSMAVDGLVPMTNRSVRAGTGWVYDAWLPAQADGVQVSYAINASNGAVDNAMSYFLVVSAPTPQGLTEADQIQWILTIAASLTMGISTIAVVYWYMGRRLRKEG